jgi:hypothetical protein
MSDTISVRSTFNTSDDPNHDAEMTVYPTDDNLNHIPSDNDESDLEPHFFERQRSSLVSLIC